MMMIGYK